MSAKKKARRIGTAALNVVLTVVVVVVAGASSLAAEPSRGPRATWIASWASSPHAADPDPSEPLLNIDGQTVRQRVRLSIGGTQIRVRLSNEHGSMPLTIGSATVALSMGPARVKPESLRPLTFDGRGGVTVPAGAPILSDPVELPVSPGGDITISLYFPERVSTPTLHALALKRAVVTPRGDFTRVDLVETQAISESSMLLNAVLVPAQPGQRLVVALGDSITDGDGSTSDADRSWPSALARRMSVSPGGSAIAIVNAGIGGNRLLADGFGIKSLGIGALARYERDVLSLPGVTHVVVLEGVNDLGFPGATLGGQPLADPRETRTAEDVIGAYRQLIARANARGVKVIGATLTPFEGVDVPGYYTQAKEAARQAVNHWIRSGNAFHGVIDFDAVLRDPNHPSRIQARYASPDRLHPNDAGYQAMADAIDLRILR
jgi:lysophospholipase L1-like esterase